MDSVNLPHLFDLSGILDEVRARTGEMVADEEILAPLRQVLPELASGVACLSAHGALAMREHIVANLEMRAKISQMIAAHPEILDEQIVNPVFITGLPRTGSTKLQRVLAASGGFQYLPLWKILNPLPLPETDGSGEDPRLAAAVAMQEQVRQAFPRLYAAHPMVAAEPDEESLFLEPHSEVLCWWARLPGFQNWLKGRHFDDTYRWLKRVLQTVQWLDETRTPKRPFVLKAPIHFRCLDDIVKVFPDAVLVLCHRDPREAVPSVAGLTEGLWQFYSDKLGGHEAGRFVFSLLADNMRSCLAMRDELDKTNPIIDVKFSDIVGNVTNVTRDIFARAGAPFGPAEIAAIAQWERQNPPHKHGAFEYSLAQYGLTAQEVTTAFAGYIAQNRF